MATKPTEAAMFKKTKGSVPWHFDEYIRRRPHAPVHAIVIDLEKVLAVWGMRVERQWLEGYVDAIRGFNL